MSIHINIIMIITDRTLGAEPATLSVGARSYISGVKCSFAAIYDKQTDEN